MTDQPYKEVQTRIVSAENIEPKSYLLSPLDLYPDLAAISLIFPVFYKYQLDGDKLADALKKLLYKYPILCGRYHPDKDTQFVIKVDPSDKERCAVPFYEIQSPLTISEAVVKHGRQVISSNGKDLIVFPFFCAETDSLSVVEGNEPILKVKLTHFADGCCVALTLSHAIADGTRYGKLLCDLSKIYRGEEIGDVCHDRSYLWPDRLVETFPMLGEEMANAPRKAAKKRAEVPYRFTASRPCELHSLHIPKNEIEGLKLKAKQIAGDSQIISSNDIVSALFWLLASEIDFKKQPITSARDLDLKNTWIFFAAEALANGYKCIPENYFGNAAAFLPALYPDHLTEDGESVSFGEALSKLAIAVRQAVVAMRNKPTFYGQAMAADYAVVSTGKLEFPLPLDKHRSLVSSNTEIKEKDADFGEGKPVFMMLAAIGRPMYGACLQTGLNRDGTLIHFFLPKNKRECVKESVVLRELVPGAKDIFDFTADELAKTIGLEE